MICGSVLLTTSMMIAGGSAEHYPDPAVIATGDRESGVAVSSDFALIADGYAGLGIHDIGDPRHPIEVGRLDTPGFAGAVAVVGATALDEAENDGSGFWIDALVFGPTGIER